MRELTEKEIKKLQNCELEILKEFDKIAKKNNLKYMLIGGTLIGAIRHKGFIPWDDDIDIGMPREDFIKFKKIVNIELDKNFFYQDIDNTDNYGLIFGKLKMKDTLLVEKASNLKKEDQAIWIDIFPFDKTSNNMTIAKLNVLKAYIYKLIYYIKCGNKLIEHTFVRKISVCILKFLSLFFTKEKCKNKLEKIYHKYDHKNNYNLVNYGGVYINKEICDSNIFDNLIDLEFEKSNFYVSKYYDKYLSNIYGDYMKLPPKEKQIPHHGIIEIKFPKK